MIDMISREFLTVLARSGRLDIIRTLKSYPGRDFTINELARISRIPTMTTWRAIKELRKAGLVKTRKIGKATCVTMTDDRECLRILRMIPDTDPQRTAAKAYATRLGREPWLHECRLFGSIGRGEHSPGDEVDVAVIYDDGMAPESMAKEVALLLATAIKEETNIAIVPLCIPVKDMARKGGLAAELRDKESIWKR